MPTALMKTDITTVSIGTTRGSAANAWEFDFRTTDDAVSFGTIIDNADSFSDGATSASKALMIVITGDAETVAIQDMDTLVVDGLTIWLPALSGDDTIYVDTDGNTWYDAALTSPAGGVDTLSDTFTMSESDFDATDFYSDTTTITDSLTAADTDYLADTITLSDGIALSVEDFIIYLNDRISLSDGLVDQFYGDFTEDTQVDATWTEI